MSGSTGGSAVHFDGVGGYIKSNQWLTGTTGAFTAEGWCRATSSASGEIVLHRANQNDMYLAVQAGAGSGTATILMWANQTASYTSPEITIGSRHQPHRRMMRIASSIFQNLAASNQTFEHALNRDFVHDHRRHRWVRRLQSDLSIFTIKAL